MDKNYFRLYAHCFLEEGAKRGAIYNLKQGDVYSVDEHALGLLKKCENGRAVADILEDYPDDLQEQVLACLYNFKTTGVGRFLKNAKKVTKMVVKKPDSFDFVWLEITPQCNLKCVHCYAKDDVSFVLLEKMRFSDWERIMKDVYGLGCRQLQFIGGEPFLNTDLLSLITSAKEIGYEMIEVFTNATLLTDEEIDFLFDNQISVAVSVYGDSHNIHDKITQVQKSFNKTVSNLRKVVKKGITVRVSIIAMNINENHIDQTIKYLKEDVGATNIKVDTVRPCGNGKSGDLVPGGLVQKNKIREPLFPNCNFEKFRVAKHGHNCFSKKLCVCANGNVLPCVMERKIILGNVFESSLQQIFQAEKAKYVRSLNKDKVEVCKDCEYRYCCFDCRPKAQGASFNNNLYAKPADCLYDPYSGEWG